MNITAETLSNFTYKDILLPLPGHSVIYPENELGVLYRDLMAKDGLSPDLMKRNVKWVHCPLAKVFVRDLSLPGAYRACFAVPKDMEWQLMNYNDPTLPLTHTDMDRMHMKASSTLGSLGSVVNDGK